MTLMKGLPEIRIM